MTLLDKWRPKLEPLLNVAKRTEQNQTDWEATESAEAIPPLKSSNF